MKIFAFAVSALLTVVQAQDDCGFIELDEPMEMDLTGLDSLMFVGAIPTVVSRMVGEPMVRVLRYTNSPPLSTVQDGVAMIGTAECIEEAETAVSRTGGSADAADTNEATSAAAMTSYVGSVASFLSLSAGSYLAGSSPAVSVGLGFAAAAGGLFPGANAQDVVCQDLVEIEIHGPALSDDEANSTLAAIEEELATLRAENAALRQSLNESITPEQLEQRLIEEFVRENALGDYYNVTLPQDMVLSDITNGDNAEDYDVAGFPIYNEFSPEPAFYLRNAHHDSLLRDMQGDIFQFPTEGNTPEDVTFTYPDPPAYSEPSDLYFKTILEIGSLLRSGAVDCVTIVQAFIDRATEFDPFLAMIVTPLYDKALEMAASHQELFNNGTDLGALMCIPYGVKDHHQVDDEPTTYGNILYGANVQSTKSSLMATLMSYGAIPIAKTTMGTYASGSVHGWGDCMSPYLNGEGGGSSCGSGSGASLGAFPFAVSEETYGSVSSPAHASLVSGHISSYGTISRTGAGLLSTEMDHLGFHTRYASDFGVVFNYMRTGADPEDGDSLDIPYVNPAEVDVTQLNVMIVAGQGSWVLNEDGEYEWDDVVDNGRDKNGWHWDLRVQRITEKLEAAGVAYTTVSYADAIDMWSIDLDSPYRDCASPGTTSLMSGGPWAQTQEFTFGFINSGWGRLPNLPRKSHRYMAHCMVEMGKQFLNDPIWSEYDVIIDTSGNEVAGRPLSGGFEMWVRTAKSFIVDYMEELPCMHTSGGTVEAGLATLTALPFEDHKNFAIASIIQDPVNLVLPNDDAIKVAFADRERCPFTFFENFNNITTDCPAINTDGAPPYPEEERDTMSNRCSGSRQHLPDEWGQSLYVPPYELDFFAPDEGINRWADYGPVACSHICPFMQSFCDAKGIVCDERRLREEEAYLQVTRANRRLGELEESIWSVRGRQMEIDMYLEAET